MNNISKTSPRETAKHPTAPVKKKVEKNFFQTFLSVCFCSCFIFEDEEADLPVQNASQGPVFKAIKHPQTIQEILMHCANFLCAAEFLTKNSRLFSEGERLDIKLDKEAPAFGLTHRTFFRSRENLHFAWSNLRALSCLESQQESMNLEEKIKVVLDIQTFFKSSQ